MTRLVRYNPFNDLLNPDYLMDRFLSFPRFDILDDLATWRWPDMFTLETPEVDIYETDKEVVVKASLPGFSEDEIEVEERSGYLTIRAKRQREEKRQGRTWQAERRQYGSWQRSVLLPHEVNADKARAELRDGVLTVTLPKVRGGKSLIKRIKVSAPKLRLPRLRQGERRVKVARK